LTTKQIVPFAVEQPDRLRKERYYDPDFFELERKNLWSRTWQMACRLEEIPEPGDFTVYEILDQSVIVVNTGADGIKAMHNACRHRGVQLADGPGNCTSGFVCPFHGWTYGPDGANLFIPQKRTFEPHNLEHAEISLSPVRCETWGGCAWINLSDEAPPLRECIEPAATILDAWKIESLRAEWWYAARLPVNWKIAEAAFQEQYHVVESHPQLVIPGMRYGAPDGSSDPHSFIDAEIKYFQTMSEGMAGMMHANDVKIAEKLRKVKLPKEREAAMTTWYRRLNDEVVKWHTKRGSDIPDLNELEDKGINEPMGYVFPHWFVLPMYSSASSYRFRPLGPEETLMEIWSLTRKVPGEKVERLPQPEVWDYDDPRWPPIPAQDFSNMPKQQRGIHAEGFEYLRLSPKGEGHLSNLERTIDGFLAGLPYKRLMKALREVNVNPLTRPLIEDLGLGEARTTATPKKR
jgi:phenylpropionate dioxygenase-like ring-hydroxylating dioxygenase large terminal subunit